ncbi:DUF1214 domain-containing protein [Pseudohongiella spirulinae]|nr:DUF1214 domain-containing protein [Pseudohongiella spirulinae]
MKITVILLAGLVFCAAVNAEPVFVGPHNFIRAETDRYMGELVEQGELGSLRHRREPTDLSAQTVIRMNLDTLYSSGVFDMEAGAVTITLPDAPDGRYISAQVISQDHFTIAVYHDGTNTFTIEDIGTRYAVVILRIFADSMDANDIAYANGLQDAVRVSQPAQGEFIVPDYESESFEATRMTLLRLGALARGNLGLFAGGPDEVDPVSHLIVTATGWGGLPRSEAAYFQSGPVPGNEDKPHQLLLSDVPANAFWSITVYNARGFMVPNGLVGVNALNNVNAKPNEDGSYRIQLGGCSDTSVNCIPTPEGWNYVLRAYQPSNVITSGQWVPPVATPIE